MNLAMEKNTVTKKMLSSINKKIVLLVFTILCFASILTCVIVNVAIDQRITWAGYTILSVPVGWLIISPSIFKKYTLSLCVLTVLTIPYLFFLERITPVSSWFIDLGLPSAIVGAILLWILYLLFRYIKINLWYKLAITIFLCGVVDILFISRFVNAHLSTETSFIEYFINISSYTIVFALLLILGFMKTRQKHIKKGGSL